MYSSANSDDFPIKIQSGFTTLVEGDLAMVDGVLELGSQVVHTSGTDTTGTDTTGTDATGTDTSGSTASYEVPPAIRRANMIVDYYLGPNSRLSNSNDPRHLLTSELSDEKRFSLGKHGWVILGFDEGFLSEKEYMVRFTESGGATEWVDIWVAQDIDPKNPVTYRREGDALNRYPILRSTEHSNFGSGHRIQSYDPNPRPPWVPENWQYVGAVQGSAGAAESDGPHLGTIPHGHYRYMLLHDSGSAVLTDKENLRDWDGADVVEIGIYLRNEFKEQETYHLLVVDLSASVEGVEGTYHTAIRAYLDALIKKPGKKRHLGLRILGEIPAEGETAAKSSDTKRVKLDGRYWRPIEYGKTEISDVWNEVRGHLKFAGNTPLKKAIQAVTDLDLRVAEDPVPSEYAGIEIPDPLPSPKFVEVILITDGLPDEKGEYGLPKDYSSADKNNTKTRIKDHILPALDAMNKRVGFLAQKLVKPGTKAEGYQPEIIGAFFTGTGQVFRDEIHALYVDKKGDLAEAENRGWLARVTDLTKAKPAAVKLPPIDHGVVFHTDCDKGDRTQARRIGVGEAKRETRGRSEERNTEPLPFLRTPFYWETPRENLAGTNRHTPRFPGTVQSRPVSGHLLPDTNLEPAD